MAPIRSLRPRTARGRSSIAVGSRAGGTGNPGAARADIPPEPAAAGPGTEIPPGYPAWPGRRWRACGGSGRCGGSAPAAAPGAGPADKMVPRQSDGRTDQPAGPVRRRREPDGQAAFPAAHARRLGAALRGANRATRTVMVALIKLGIDVNAKDEDGLTALDYAMGARLCPLPADADPAAAGSGGDAAHRRRQCGACQDAGLAAAESADCHGRLRRRHLAGRPGRTLNAHFPSSVPAQRSAGPFCCLAAGRRARDWPRPRTRIRKSVSAHDISVKDVSGLAVFAGAGCNVVGLAGPDGALLVDGGLAVNSAVLLKVSGREPQDPARPDADQYALASGADRVQ